MGYSRTHFSKMAAVLCIWWTGACLAQTTIDELARATSLAAAGLKQLHNGNYVEAEHQIRDALELQERLLPAGSMQLGTTLNALGAALQYQSRFAEAEAAYKRALAIYGDQPEHRAARVSTLLNLSTVRREQGHLADAAVVQPELLAAVEAKAVSEATEAGIWNDRGLFLKLNGDLDGAERALNRAAAISERRLAGGDPSAIRVWTSLADVFYSRRDYPRAETLFRQAAETCERVLSRDDRLCAPALNGLALCMKRRGLIDEPAAIFERALGIFERAYGPNHPKAAAVLNNLGTLATLRRDFKRSDEYLLRAVDVWTRAYGPAHPDIASAYTNLAANAMEKRRWAEAENWYHKALNIDETAFGGTNSKVALDFNNLAVLYSRTKRYTEADECFAKSILIHDQSKDSNKAALVNVLLNQANQQYVRKQYFAAAEGYKRALEIQQSQPIDQSTDIAVSFENYARLSRKLANYAEAEKAEALAMRLRVRQAITNERLGSGFSAEH